LSNLCLIFAKPEEIKLIAQFIIGKAK